jgi:uncharacterized protein YkwD
MLSVLVLFSLVLSYNSLSITHDGQTSLNINDLINAELSQHNFYRAKHGSPPLVLNDSLNTAALSYSQKLSSTHTFVHSPSAGKYGENLYKSWGRPTVSYSSHAASDAWYAEQQYYNYGTFNSTNPSQVVGHFTALIWKSVKSVGFGYSLVAENGGYAVYVVANYYPPPNYIGQYEANVLKPI